MRNLKTVFLLGIFIIFFVNLWFFTKTLEYLNAKEKFGDQLFKSLVRNRMFIDIFFKDFNEYPVLEDGNVHFWDIKCNQYVWHCQFKNLVDIASNPVAEEEKRAAVGKVLDKEKNKMVEETDETRKELVNPFTGKFDWLAEGLDGKLYSPDMPRELLLASPPIRIKNIRSPQTASDTPFFEDFTKW